VLPSKTLKIPSLKSYVYGKSVKIPNPSGSYAGHKFIGWFDAASGGNKITSISSKTIGTQTLYARYEQADKPSIIMNPIKDPINDSGKNPTEPNPSDEPESTEPLSIRYGWIALDINKNPILAGTKHKLNSGKAAPIAYISNGVTLMKVNPKAVIYLCNTAPGDAQALIVGNSIIGCKDAFITTFKVVN
jgi:hypothetical protein